jgi:hypothetical protein
MGTSPDRCSAPLNLRRRQRCPPALPIWRMPICPHCQQTTAPHDGHDRDCRRRFTCAKCGGDFTRRSASAFSRFRWSADVIPEWRCAVTTPPTVHHAIELLADIDRPRTADRGRRRRSLSSGRSTSSGSGLLLTPRALAKFGGAQSQSVRPTQHCRPIAVHRR